MAREKRYNESHFSAGLWMDDSVARFSRFRVATIISPPVVGSLRAAHIIVFPGVEGVCFFDFETGYPGYSTRGNG